VLTGHGCKIAPSGYYAAKKRPPSKRSLRDEVVLAHVVRVHCSRRQGRWNYGAKKVWVELGKEQERGEYTGLGRVPRCQVERLMRTQCLRGRRRGRQFVTTCPDSKAVRAPDLVKREFTASNPNQLWVVDFTYVVTWAGTAFTAFVIDVFSRRIVGWGVAGRMPTALPLDALEMALWTRQQTHDLIDGLIHHSDAGSQYTSIMYTDRLIDAGALASIGTVGDSYDNAMAESTIGLYKAEMVWPEGPWRDVDHLELATADHVWWFNNQRIHSSIGYDTPVEHEQKYYAQQQPGEQIAPGQKALH
jgi:putative transposase